MGAYTSKISKHGHSKAFFVGMHLFTSKKFEFACTTSHSLDVPVVKRFEYILSMLDETTGDVSVITEAGELKSDLNLPTILKAGEPTAEDVQLQRTIVQAFEAGRTVKLAVVAACGDE